jgi:RNA polymerase sigma-70 factor, ECF subfamily
VGAAPVDGEDLSDEQLMLMFRYGNRAAFGLLFEKHRAGVYSFARRMLGSRSAAEDVVQEAFLRVVGAAGAYEPSARFQTWLWTIVRNCAVSLLRRHNPVAIALPEAVADPRECDPPEAAHHAETLERLEQAIDKLAPAQRETFLLRYRHDMTYDEIADVTGQPLGTVKTHIHRARLRLAEVMAKMLELDP